MSTLPLDPAPYVYFRRRYAIAVTSAHWFEPRDGYSQNREDYENA